MTSTPFPFSVSLPLPSPAGVVPTDPKQPFDVRAVLARVLDGSRFHEFKKNVSGEGGQSIIVAAHFPVSLSLPQPLAPCQLPPLSLNYGGMRWVISACLCSPHHQTSTKPITKPLPPHTIHPAVRIDPCDRLWPALRHPRGRGGQQWHPVLRWVGVFLQSGREAMYAQWLCGRAPWPTAASCLDLAGWLAGLG